MKYCNNCGHQLDDSAKFCAKCGSAAAPFAAGSEHPTQAQTQSNETVLKVERQTEVNSPEKSKYNFFDVIKRFFWLMYISFGLCSVLLVDLGFKFIWSGGKGFIIVCGVFAILAAIVFLAYGILNKIAVMRENGEDKQKHTQRANLCMIISIIVFVYVLVAATALFCIFR